MSANSQASGSFENRMQDISEYLKSKVIDPAETEKKRILEDAEAERKKILDDARAEAEKIIDDAKKEADKQKSALDSALHIASRQAVDSLKLALEKEVLKQSIEEPVGDILSAEAVMKECLNQIIEIYLNSDSEAVDLVLSRELHQKLSDYLKDQIREKAASTVTLSSETIPSGFSVKLSDKQLEYDFSQESLVELLSQFLRPELREYLFSKQG